MTGMIPRILSESSDAAHCAEWKIPSFLLPNTVLSVMERKKVEWSEHGSCRRKPESVCQRV